MNSSQLLLTIGRLMDELHAVKRKNKILQERLHQQRKLRQRCRESCPYVYLYAARNGTILEQNRHLPIQISDKNYPSTLRDLKQALHLQAKEHADKQNVESFFKHLLDSNQTSPVCEFKTDSRNLYKLTAQRFQNKQKKIVGIAIFVRDISLEQHIENQLRQEQLQRTIVEQRNKENRVFLSYLGHDLKTPLNAILLLARSIEPGMPASTRLQHIQQIQESSDLLLDMVENVVTWLTDTPAEVTLLSMVELLSNLSATFNLFKNFAKQHGLIFHLILSADLPAYIETDQNKLFRVIQNLVSNAIKYTQSGYVQLSIGFSHADKKLFIRVNDSGKGITSEQQAGFFQPLWHEYNGAGTPPLSMGSSICQHFVRLLHGQLEIKSLAEGTSVSVDIPVLKLNNYPSKEENKIRILVLENSYLDLQKIYFLPTHPLRIKRKNLRESFLLLPRLGKNESHFFILDREDWLEIIRLDMDFFNFLSQQRVILIFVRLNIERIPIFNAITPIIVCNHYRELKLLSRFNVIAYYAKQNQPENKNNLTTILEEKSENIILNKLRVLAIDDNPHNLIALNAVFKRYSIKYDNAENVEAAWKLIDKSPIYHIILVDKRMPNIDGICFIKEFQNSPFRIPNQKIYLVTADNNEFMYEGLDELAIDGILMKPIQEKKMLEVLMATAELFSSREQVINYEMLTSLLRLDTSLLKSIFDSFEKNSRLVIDEIISNKKSILRDQLIESIHKLKGIALQVGARKLAEFCEQQQQCPDLDLIPLSYERIREEFILLMKKDYELY